MSDEDEMDEVDQTTAEGYMLKAGQDPDEARRRYDANRAVIERRGEPPAIVTRAQPSSEWLREARSLLNQEGRVRNFVALARHQKMSAAEAVDGLSFRLNTAFGGGLAAEMHEVARYLWDEQAQLGEGLYVISQETGRVVGVVTEHDFYQPAPVPREDGSLVLPQPRLKPALEAALVCWAHDSSREAQLRDQLAARAHQTVLLREDGDPRLLVASKAGRRHIVESFAAIDPQLLFQSAGGTSGTFLRRFHLTAQDPPDATGLTLITGVAISATTMNVSDATTTNLRHNRAATVGAALVQGWTREIARQLSLAAIRQEAAPEVRPADLKIEHLKDSDFWVTPPDAVRFVQKVAPKAALMPVSGANLIGVLSAAGTLVVPAEFEALSREMFDRWEASTHLTFRLWVDWSRIRALRLIDLEHRAQPV